MLLDIVEIPNRYTQDLLDPVIDTSGVQFDQYDECELVGHRISMHDLKLSCMHKYLTVEVYGNLLVERMLLSYAPLNIDRVKAIGKLDDRLYCAGVKYTRMDVAAPIVPAYVCCPDAADLLHTKLGEPYPNTIKALLTAANTAHEYAATTLADEIMRFVKNHRNELMFTAVSETNPRYVFLDIWNDSVQIGKYLQERVLLNRPKDPISSYFLNRQGSIEALRQHQLAVGFHHHVLRKLEQPNIKLDNTWKLCEDSVQASTSMYDLVLALYQFPSDIISLCTNVSLGDHAQSGYKSATYCKSYRTSAPVKMTQEEAKPLWDLLRVWIRAHEADQHRQRVSPIDWIVLMKHWTNEITIEYSRKDGTTERCYIDLFFYMLGARVI